MNFDNEIILKMLDFFQFVKEGFLDLDIEAQLSFIFSSIGVLLWKPFKITKKYIKDRSKSNKEYAKGLIPSKDFSKKECDNYAKNVVALIEKTTNVLVFPKKFRMIGLGSVDFSSKEEISYISERRIIENLFSGNRLLIVGAGGVGKSVFVNQFVNTLYKKNVIPCLVTAKTDHQQDIPKSINDIFMKSVNIENVANILSCCKYRRVVLIIDGINQWSVKVQKKVFDLIEKELSSRTNFYVTIVDRINDDHISKNGWQTVEICSLDIAFVKSLLNDSPYSYKYENLSEKYLNLLCIPFYLDIFIDIYSDSTSTFPAKSNIRTGLFQKYFKKHVGINGDDFIVLSEMCFKEYEKYKSAVVGKRALALLEQNHFDIYQKLVTSGILGARTLPNGKISTYFVHHLFMDYFLSIWLKENPANWDYRRFDVVSIGGSSIEPIALTLEMLQEETDVADQFIDKVFDWNYKIAAAVIANVQSTIGVRPVSENMFMYLLFTLGEKQFDSSYKTKKFADSVLSRHPDQIATQLKQLKSIDAFLEFSSSFEIDDDWIDCFCCKDYSKTSTETINKLFSGKAVRGWAIANAFRRGGLTVTKQKFFRDQFKTQSKSAIQWRIVHVIGAYPCKENIIFLLEIMQTKEIHFWVKYGTIRAVMEIASECESDFQYIVGELSIYFQELSEKLLMVIARMTLTDKMVEIISNKQLIALIGKIKPYLMQQHYKNELSTIISKHKGIDTGGSVLKYH